MRLRLRRLAPHLAGLGLGLYLARVSAEVVRVVWSLPALVAWAVLGAAVGLGLARFLVWEFKIDSIAGIELRPSPEELAARHALPLPLWAAWPLWLYVLWPWQEPTLAWGVGLVSALAWLLHRYRIANLPIYQSTKLTGITFFVALLVYTLTLSPGLQPADGGEFQLVAARFDLAHPPGYPLYSILGGLFVRLPLGPNPAWRLNLFSALTAAATLALVGLVARRIGRGRLAGLVAPLVLGSATTFWATATAASIRPLTVFFTALMLYALTAPRFSCQILRFRLCVSRPTLFGLALGLGLAHHASLLFLGAVCLVYLFLVDPALVRQPRRWLVPLAAFGLTQLIWLYLPLRNPTGDLNTLGGFLDYALARGFQGDMFAFATPEHLPDRLALLPTILRFQFGPLLPLVGLAGGLSLLYRGFVERSRAWKWFVLLVGGFAVHTFITLTYRAPQTLEYELPAYLLLALLVGYGLGQIWRPAGDRPSVGRSLIAAIVLVTTLFQAIAAWPSFRHLARRDDARQHARSLLQAAPQGAVILSNWHWSTSLDYLQAVEGQRPDLQIEYVPPQGSSLAQNWVHAIQCHIDQRPVVVVRYFGQEYAPLPYRFEPLGPAFLVRPGPTENLPAGLTPLDVDLGAEITLLGYGLESSGSSSLDRPLVLTLAWTPQIALQRDVALFAHLFGPTGLSGQAPDRRHPAASYQPGEVILDRFVVYSFAGVQPGEYVLTVGAYQPEAPGAPRLTTADGTDHVSLVTIELQPGISPPVTTRPRRVPFAGGPTLVGIDYDTGLPGQLRLYLHWRGQGGLSTLDTHVRWGDQQIARTRVDLPGRGYVTTVYDLPAEARSLELVTDRRFSGPWGLGAEGLDLPQPRPGERYVPIGGEMVLTGVERSPTRSLLPGEEVGYDLRLVASRPLLRDRIVSVSLVGLEPDGSWSWRALDDSVPALGAVPTFKWVSGSTVWDRHRLTVPPDAPAGPANGTLLIYDHYTQAVLPPLDQRLWTWGLSVPLHTWTVAPPP